MHILEKPLLEVRLAAINRYLIKFLLHYQILALCDKQGVVVGNLQLAVLLLPLPILWMLSSITQQLKYADCFGRSAQRADVKYMHVFEVKTELFGGDFHES